TADLRSGGITQDELGIPVMRPHFLVAQKYVVGVARYEGDVDPIVIPDRHDLTRIFTNGGIGINRRLENGGGRRIASNVCHCRILLVRVAWASRASSDAGVTV